MPTGVLTRRTALLIFPSLAAAGLGGCNTTGPAGAPMQGASQPAVAGFRISSIAVDTGPLLAQSGNPTATWVQDALPGALAKAFASHMAPGDPSGEALSVTVNSVILASVGPSGSATDWMMGVATLGGRHTRLRGTSTYIPTTGDQALFVQAAHDRVTALSQSFAYWLARRWRR
jgi:hypothetical protein